ncbi:MAG: aminotransferase class V-fold PLP-dependent enzyme [Eubacteriales bacterium]|nr:aminotransferase class V-fold PLP-dependent enzyme [Eubacteriales bacterium]MDD4390837.1 aminotransferase class V-fold PLP-dependent enzyme [Eubacteriales bacterium]
MKNKYVSPILENIRNYNFNGDMELAGKYALDYINSVNSMRVYPSDEDIAALSVFDIPLGDEPTPNAEILDKLHNYGSKATVAQTGPRYFGFVCGGILPSSLSAKWLMDAWDQNPAMFVMSPIAGKIEEICEKWLVELLNLPKGTAAGFVSGSSTAINCALLAGRNHILKNLGYNVSAAGLNDAPKIKVVLSEGAHSTVFKALSIIGLGQENLIKVPMDEQGCICADKIPELDKSTLLLLQAGNVNSGGFDDFKSICKKANEAGAWVHVDGAFGLWAAASEEFAHLTEGMEYADSWSMDAHKTLNAPYDNGVVLCKHRDSLVNAMHMTGGYIQITEGNRDSMMYTMEMSRRARALDIWATLMGLGKRGLSELVKELHTKAVYFADELKSIGLSVLNDVVFNQVIVRYEDDEKTKKLIDAIQKSGVLWLGPSSWQGNAVMRVSVCSYKTTYEDIDICVKEIKRLKEQI